MNKKLFFTYFMARSGSKFLRSLLNNHPDIKDFGEIFHNRNNTYPEKTDVSNKLINLLLYKEPLIGIQYRYPRHPKEFPEIMEIMVQNKSNIKLIFLERKNKLKAAISQQNAEFLKKTTGKAHLFNDSKEDINLLTLDVNRAVKEARNREKLDQKELDWVKDNFQVFHLYYEDLSNKTDESIRSILGFLGVTPFKNDFKFQSNLKKITSDNINDVLTNYDELKTALTPGEQNRWL